MINKTLKILSLFIILFSATAFKNDDFDSVITIGVFPRSPLLNITHELLEGNSEASKFARFLRDSELNYNIKEYSWMRGYRELQGNSNVLFYALSRTPERENIFKWVLPLYKIDFSLYGRPNADQSQWTNDNLLAGSLKIACTKLSNECEYLKTLGIPNEAIIEIVPSYNSQLIQLILKKRVDFVFQSEQAMEDNSKILGMTLRAFPRSTIIDFQYIEYLTSSKNVDPAIVSIIKDAAAKTQYGRIK